MPRISKEKRDKIKEAIIHYLFQQTPRALFTSHVAREIARDEEFTKELLLLMNKEGFIKEINKNPKGISYLRRQRWSLSDSTYQAYKSIQDKQKQVEYIPQEE